MGGAGGQHVQERINAQSPPRFAFAFQLATMQALSSVVSLVQQHWAQLPPCPASGPPCKRARTACKAVEAQMRAAQRPLQAAESAPAVAASGRRAVLGLGAAALLLGLQPQLGAAQAAADLAPVTIRTELTPDWSLYDALDPQVWPAARPMGGGWVGSPSLRSPALHSVPPDFPCTRPPNCS